MSLPLRWAARHRARPRHIYRRRCRCRCKYCRPSRSCGSCTRCGRRSSSRNPPRHHSSSSSSSASPATAARRVLAPAGRCASTRTSCAAAPRPWAPVAPAWQHTTRTFHASVRHAGRHSGTFYHPDLTSPLSPPVPPHTHTRALPPAAVLGRLIDSDAIHCAHCDATLPLFLETAIEDIAAESVNQAGCHNPLSIPHSDGITYRMCGGDEHAVRKQHGGGRRGRRGRGGTGEDCPYPPPSSPPSPFPQPMLLSRCARHAGTCGWAWRG